MKEKVDVVKIEWVDSDCFEGWHKPEEIINITTCLSVGIIENETKELIRIKQSESSNGNSSDSLTIPKCSIKKIIRIKL